MRKKLFACLAVLLTAGLLQSTAQESIAVAAASDLQAVLPQIADRFQRDTGAAVRTSFGSSGNFSAQIQNGAPFDVFLSADIEYPKQLERAGLTEPGALYQYAVGEIVVIALKGRNAAEPGLRGLTGAGVKRVAIANPEHAPYGRAAVAALKSAGIYEQVQAKLVLGENVSQAAQFVQSGNADAGIVALSLSLAPGLRDAIDATPVPANSYPPIEQGAVVIRASRNKAAAVRFLAFLRTPPVVSLLREFGFRLPAATTRP